MIPEYRDFKMMTFNRWVMITIPEENSLLKKFENSNFLTSLGLLDAKNWSTLTDRGNIWFKNWTCLVEND